MKTCPATTSSIATIPPILLTPVGCTDGDVYVERNWRNRGQVVDAADPRVKRRQTPPELRSSGARQNQIRG